MRLVRRLTTGFDLTRDSLTVLRNYPTLVAFPLLGGIGTLAFGAVLYLTVFVADLVGGWLTLLALFGFYVVTTFVASFFTAALVASVDDVFHGREPTVRAGVAAAWAIKRELAVWAVISAVVGVILRSLERSESLLSRYAAGLFAVGWTITTLFVVPVLVFEDVSVRRMFSNSASTFKRTWGETLSANFGIGLLQGVVWLGGVAVIVAVGAGLFSLVPWLGTSTVILGVIGLSVAVYLVGRTVTGIVKTVLYVYATEGTVPPAFADFDFETLEGRVEASTPSDDADSPTT
ncbi:MAG: DUF6159 family protein [Euryarchaeota archaeon]|nr:DUF6159 family protein [Euryarchaeota archaeon]